MWVNRTKHLVAVICDGENILPLASSQDHKRLKNNDVGPNTGGMGAYSPAPIVSKEIHGKIMKQIIVPTIKGMKKDGIKFQGFLYAGVIVDKDKNIKTLEFNCRMGTVGRRWWQRWKPSKCKR